MIWKVAVFIVVAGLALFYALLFAACWVTHRRLRRMKIESQARLALLEELRVGRADGQDAHGTGPTHRQDACATAGQAGSAEFRDRGGAGFQGGASAPADRFGAVGGNSAAGGVPGGAAPVVSIFGGKDGTQGMDGRTAR